MNSVAYRIYLSFFRAFLGLLRLRDGIIENSVECFLVTVNKVYIFLCPVHKC